MVAAEHTAKRQTCNLVRQLRASIGTREASPAVSAVVEASRPDSAPTTRNPKVRFLEYNLPTSRMKQKDISMYKKCFPALGSILVLLAGTIPLHAAALDSTLFTTYTMNTARTNLNWTVCGSLPTTEGCYGSGTLSPFGKIGAIIEGLPSQNLNKGTVTRYIYVLDVAYASGLNGVALYVYKKVDTINSSDDAVAVTLYKTVILPLTGGSSTVASMAANKKFLFIGTNQDDLAVQLTKTTFAFTQYGEVSGPATVIAITSDAYGFVTTTWLTSSNVEAFNVIDPNGMTQEGGGGGSFMLNTNQAVQPSTLP